MASADFCLITRQIALQGAMRILLALLSMVRSYSAIATEYAGTFAPRWSCPGSFTMQISSHVRQISPDKNVNFRYATAAFTVSPKPRVLSCGADLPGDSALYAISVRRLIALHSSFLRTVPHKTALAIG